MKRITILLYIAILGLILTGCASSAYQKAKSQDTIEAYKEFLAKYPDSEYAYEARQRLDDLLYQELKLLPDDTLRQKFLEENPKSKHYKEINDELATTRYQDAKNLGTIESYETFLKYHPKDPRAKEIKELLDEARYKELMTSKKATIEDYEKFLASNPSREYRDKILAKLESLRFEQIKAIDSVSAYEDFMRKYPQSSYISYAQARYEDLRYKNATIEDTIEGYNEFLKTFPNSKNAKKVKDRIDYLNVLSKHDISSLERFIRENPFNIYRNEISDKIEVLKLKQSTLFDEVGVQINIKTLLSEGEDKARIIGRIFEVIERELNKQGLKGTEVKNLAQSNKNAFIVVTYEELTGSQYGGDDKGLYGTDVNCTISLKYRGYPQDIWISGIGETNRSLATTGTSSDLRKETISNFWQAINNYTMPFIPHWNVTEAIRSKYQISAPSYEVSGGQDRFSQYVGNKNDLLMWGDYIITTYKNNLYIFNPQGGKSFNLISSLSLNADSLNNIAIQGNTLYVSTGRGGIRVVDLQDPSHPRETKIIDIGFAGELALYGSYLYVASWTDGITMINVSSESDIKVITTIKVKEGPVKGLFINKETMFVNIDNYGLKILNLSNAISPVIVGSFPQKDIVAMTMSGNQLSLLIGGVSPQIMLLDISNLSSLRVVSVLKSEEFRNPYAIQGTKNYLFVTSKSSNFPLIHSDLKIIDIHNRQNPRIVGLVPLPDPGAILVTGGYAFVAGSTFSKIDLTVFQ